MSRTAYAARCPRTSCRSIRVTFSCDRRVCLMSESAETEEQVQEPGNPVVERLQDSLVEAQRNGEAIGLLLVQAAAIDRIDALHGFHAGDRMSNSITHLLRTKALRKRDLIESLSRDEFACV